MRNWILFGVVGVFACGGALLSGAGAFAESSAIDVQVAPGTILIGAEQANQITVHAAIAYSVVDSESIDLNGVAPVSTWADDRGELVARFSPVDVEALPEVQALGDVVLTLTGLTDAGDVFSGSDVVRVVAFAGSAAAQGK